MTSDDPANMSIALIAFIDHDTGWIIDSGAIDHMIYDRTLFNSMVPPQRNSIITENRGIVLVTEAGFIALTSNLSLQNCFPVPSLFSNLLYVGQVTEQLNRVMLMFPTFYLL